jgi:hypothetical protein
LLRFVFIDRTSNADVFSPTWGFNHLMGKSDDFTLGLPGERFFRSDNYKGRLWSWSDPDVPQDFMEVVESFALPKLREIRTLKEYFDFAEPKNFSSKNDGGFRLMFSIVFGDLDRARELLAEKSIVRE